MSEKGQKHLAAVRELSKLATDIGTTMPRLAIAWCLA